MCVCVGGGGGIRSATSSRTPVTPTVLWSCTLFLSTSPSESTSSLVSMGIGGRDGECVCVWGGRGDKECYIFKDPRDPHCPVVMHFVLINITFIEYLKPGQYGDWGEGW